eukprot:jgi/Hompol1/1725/HPOL_001926-RA
MITKRSAVALIGGHYIYHIDETIMLNLSAPSKLEKKSDEARYMQIFGQVDINKNFYYSYSYDITSSLQKNLSLPPGREHFQANDMFIWNSYMNRDIFSSPNSIWRLNIIHGFVDQSKISVFGHNIFVTLIARRSRHYAGARFLKRGVNDQGYVANDVETEQIVHDAATTSFYALSATDGQSPNYTSFLQHRGSIPVYWTQEATPMAAKPQIALDYIDPYYSATALHFDNMLKRYGAPIMVLNLTKERVKRESILLDQFDEAVKYLNQFLPKDKLIEYIAWDMARASKSNDQNVIEILEDLAEQVLATTRFFHGGAEPHINAERRAKESGKPVQRRTEPLLQSGILRTNCVDCLDRTNAAQFVVGKCALAHQ